MLQVISPEEAKQQILSLYSPNQVSLKYLDIAQALNRVLAEDIISKEDVPGFNRSTVDGYAVIAKNTFGCSQSTPALLRSKAEVEMGKPSLISLNNGECIYVPTGGQMPPDSDAVAMIEHTENYNSTEIGVLNPVAPGQNCIFQGDDVKKGQTVLKAGTLVQAHDIGALAAMGLSKIPVARRPLVGILSTGDELVEVEATPGPGQIRDVNSYLLDTAVKKDGGKVANYGICQDNLDELVKYLKKMAQECDVLVLSGGSSVGTRDAMPKAISALGKIHFHGIAIKPGKPTIFGEIMGKPVFGLPGNPVAAYFMYLMFTSPLLAALTGQENTQYKLQAILGEKISSNHGRAECLAVKLENKPNQLIAYPVFGKSGLITLLCGSQGYIYISRNQEGLAKGSVIDVTLF